MEVTGQQLRTWQQSVRPVRHAATVVEALQNVDGTAASAVAKSFGLLLLKEFLR